MIISTYGDRWPVAERHYKEVTAILRQTGCMDEKGRIRKWNAEVRQALEKAGHSTMGAVENCTCWKSAPNKGE